MNLCIANLLFTATFRLIYSPWVFLLDSCQKVIIHHLGQLRQTKQQKIYILTFITSPQTELRLKYDNFIRSFLSKTLIDDENIPTVCEHSGDGTGREEVVSHNW